MDPLLGRAVLGLSAAGYPLTEAVTRRLGRPGALAVAAVCLGLLVRDTVLIARGAHRRLQRGPAILLWLETLSAGAATATTLRRALDVQATTDESPGAQDREALRCGAVGALFGLHTVRFAIYLRPDHGLRNP